MQRAEKKDRRRVAVDRFIEEQRRTRELINFADIADWLARRDNPVVPNETARSGAYDLLRDDLQTGDFEEDGKSQVRFMHPNHETEWISRRRIVDCENEKVISLLDVMDSFLPEDVIAQYLAHCWIPRRIFHRWLAKHQLPLSPPRFEPLEKSKAAINDTEQNSHNPIVSADVEHIDLPETKQFTTAASGRSQPSSNSVLISRQTISLKKAEEFVTRYISEAYSAGRQPTQVELEEKAKNEGLRGRQRLRKQFRSQLGSSAPSRGRPTKRVK